jgi:hypothetical protein
LAATSSNFQYLPQIFQRQGSRVEDSGKTVKAGKGWRNIKGWFRGDGMRRREDCEIGERVGGRNVRKKKTKKECRLLLRKRVDRKIRDWLGEEGVRGKEDYDGEGRTERGNMRVE